VQHRVAQKLGKKKNGMLLLKQEYVRWSEITDVKEYLKWMKNYS